METKRGNVGPKIVLIVPQTCYALEKYISCYRHGGMSIQKRRMRYVSIGKSPRSSKETHQIEEIRSIEKQIEATKYVKVCYLEEVHVINKYISQLEISAENACGFLHQSTGGSFPKYTSLVNPNWSIQEGVASDGTPCFSTPVVNAIQDVFHVRAILE